jgi:hypothetical protein
VTATGSIHHEPLTVERFDRPPDPSPFPTIAEQEPHLMGAHEPMVASPLPIFPLFRTWNGR